MRLLAKLDSKNYDSSWPRSTREAARAIIVMPDGMLVMVRSGISGFYKFPGGGIEPGETHIDALVRETREETGLVVDESSIEEYGMVNEIRRSKKVHSEIFEQNSYYYFAEVTGARVELELDDYERELGYSCVFVAPGDAYEFNKRLAINGGAAFLSREAYVLQLLLQNGELKRHI